MVVSYHALFRKGAHPTFDLLIKPYPWLILGLAGDSPPTPLLVVHEKKGKTGAHPFGGKQLAREASPRDGIEPVGMMAVGDPPSDHLLDLLVGVRIFQHILS